MSVKLVGILNVTPDSFSDSGMFLDIDKAAAHAEQLFDDGADIVDIGGAATNPWATQISASEELDRIEALGARLLPGRPDYSYSIDTYRPEVVKRLAQYGKFIVNDVTTFINPEMIAVTARYGFKAIASHMPLLAEGDVEFAHTLQMSDQDMVEKELQSQKQKMIHGGILPEDIILDPGIGFGKTPQLNWRLLEFWNKVQSPVMIGYSRKRFLQQDKQTGFDLPGVSKLSDTVNLNAANLVLIGSQRAKHDIFLRVHAPRIYRHMSQLAA